MNKPGHGEFFYLTNNHSDPRQGGIKTVTLQQDISRGVTRLSDDSYSDAYGVTATSLRFFNYLRTLMPIVGISAELKQNSKGYYRLIVKTVNGYDLVFTGVSGGYFGEGPRGAYDILKASGFNERQCQSVFEKEAFRISRRV